MEVAWGVRKHADGIRRRETSATELCLGVCGRVEVFACMQETDHFYLMRVATGVSNKGGCEKESEFQREGVQ